MASFGPKLTGISLSVLGWVLSVISGGLPMWRVPNREEWLGLWMSCDSQSTGRMQCSCHWFIHPKMQAVMAPSIIAIIAGVLGIFINIVTAECTNCVQNERVKARLMASSGGVFITAALAQLVLVFWLVCTISWEKVGVALCLGWAASVLMLVGGSILCCICTPEEDRPMKYNLDGQSYVEYSAMPRSTAQSSDNKRDEV